MVGQRGGVTGWFDGAVGLLRGAALPWAGLLVLCSVPLRCLEAHLLGRALSFGAAANDYWPYLGALSGLVTLALVPALWARAVFARAVTLLAAAPGADDGPTPGQTREILRLPLGPTFVYAALALAVEITFWLLAWLILPLPLLWLASGAVVATLPWLSSANLWHGLREVVRSLPGFWVTVGLFSLLAVGWVITFFNLVFLFQLGVHLAAGLVPGFDSAWWLGVLTPQNDTFLLLLVAGATLLMEPVGLAALTLAAAARRSRQTGDDLVAWFRVLTRTEVGPGALRCWALGGLLGLGLVGGGAAFARPLAEYQGGVAEVTRAIERGEADRARELAASLLAEPVTTPAGETLAPDRSVLTPLVSATDLAELRAGLPRLRALARALATTAPGATAAAPDRDLLAQLAVSREENLARGEGPDFRGGPPQGIDAVRDLLAPFRDAVTKFFREFFDWLRELFRREGPAGGSWLEQIDLPTLVAILVGAFALTLLVIAIRQARRRRAPATTPEVPVASATDADPLSRDLSGWQRYARELAAAGRTREAIRAWYHAVLVTLYGSGRVTYRKGRTNWELIATLSPGHRWRPRFIELTRLFEREWYGHHESSPSALDDTTHLAGDLLAELQEAA